MPGATADAGGTGRVLSGRWARMALLWAVLGGVAGAGALVLVGPPAAALVLGVTFGALLFLVAAAAFVAVPHVAVAAVIPYFAALPTLKLFVSPLLGGTKDVVTLAAVAAGGSIVVRSRAEGRPLTLDRAVVAAVALLLALYCVNLGAALSSASGYGWEWFHGVRLFAEPMALLLAGMVLPRPRRTLRWAVTSLAGTAALVAAYGIVQQGLGVERLLSLGYRYGQEVRQIGSDLRSFGTLDEPFAYAAFLLLGAAALLFGGRRSPRTHVLLALVGCGLVASLVRTAALGAAALLVLAVVRRTERVRVPALPVLAACGAAAIAVAAVLAARTDAVGGLRTYVPLAARAELWREAVGSSPTAWTFGRGVGTVGTASQRASKPLVRADRAPATSGVVVDSSYVVTVSNVGVIGLVVLLGLFGRLLVLARRAAARREEAGWIAAGVLTVVLIDSLTRESLTSFPLAYVAMALVGVSTVVGTAPEDQRNRPGE